MKQTYAWKSFRFCPVCGSELIDGYRIERVFGKIPVRRCQHYGPRCWFQIDAPGPEETTVEIDVTVIDYCPASGVKSGVTRGRAAILN